MNTYNKEYYLKNKERIKEHTKKYREANYDRVVAKQNEWYIANPKKRLLMSVRARAKREGVEYSITEDDFDMPDNCPYLNTPLKFVYGEGRIDSNPSLDRIDSSKGYVKGNVQVISKKANTMKSDATEEELLTFARNILVVHSRTRPTETPTEQGLLHTI